MIALKQMDIEKVKEFLSDDLVWTHASGRVDSKGNQIASMEAGEIVSWPPKTGQVAKRESQLGMAVWPKVRHGKYPEEAQS